MDQGCVFRRIGEGEEERERERRDRGELLTEQAMKKKDRVGERAGKRVEAMCLKAYVCSVDWRWHSFSARVFVCYLLESL
jgi:hypothetical protein